MWLFTPRYDKLSRDAIAGSNTRATIGMMKFDMIGTRNNCGFNSLIPLLTRGRSPFDRRDPALMYVAMCAFHH